jgi:hypothetical protein
LRFIPFPKPCLIFRKMDINQQSKAHIKTCPTCKQCCAWVKNCKRNDAKWRSIRNITKDTYICEDHFVDFNAVPLPLPLPASKIIEMKVTMYL